MLSRSEKLCLSDCYPQTTAKKTSRVIDKLFVIRYNKFVNLVKTLGVKISYGLKPKLMKKVSETISIDKTQELDQSKTASANAEFTKEISAPPKKRVWEVDFLRGIMILFVVWDHTLNDVRVDAGGNYKTALFQAIYDFSCRYSSGNLRAVCQPAFVIMFIFTAGLSCSFSSDNFKRALKLMAVSVFLTLGGFVVSVVLKRHMIVYFNVIHVIALSVFLWSVIEFFWKKCKKNWQKNVFGLTMTAVTLTVLIVGACAKREPWTDDNSHWFFLAQHVGEDYNRFMSMDYRTFFPDFGWFLIGAFLGKALYKDKRTLFESVNPKYLTPVTVCGRKTLLIYFVSKIVTFGFIYLFHGILDWL